MFDCNGRFVGAETESYVLTISLSQEANEFCSLLGKVKLRCMITRYETMNVSLNSTACGGAFHGDLLLFTDCRQPMI